MDAIDGGGEALSAALVVGKFYPPHGGHIALVRHALTLRDRVVVLALGTPGDSLPMVARAAILCEELESEVDAGRVIVRYATDATPYDLESDAVWRSHVALFRAMLEPDDDVDVLVSSEGYGDRLARALGIGHATFDAARGAHPVSSTWARSDLHAAWPYLPAATRAALSTRVVVVGAESTGTTTIAGELADVLRARGGVWADTQVVPEVGRDWTVRKQVEQGAELSVEWGPEDFVGICRAQDALEHELAAASGPVVICDTDSFVTPIWERRYLGDAAELQARDWGQGDVYLVTHVEGVPFEQDGVRDGEQFREWMTAEIIDQLLADNRPVVVLTGTREERLALAVRTMDEVAARKARFTEPY